MTRHEALAVLSDGESHFLPPGEAEVLVAGGAAEFVCARTLEEGVAIKVRGQRAMRITDTGRRRAAQTGATS